MKSFKHIIVGVDFSPASKAALKTAMRFAGFDGANVTVVHVMDATLASELKTVHDFTDEQLFASIASRLRLFMEQAEVSAEKVDIDLDVGNPFVGLVAACQRRSADLLVLGSRGTEHAPDQIGTVAAKCIRKAPADVLVVRMHMAGPFRQVLACVDLSETSAKAVRDASHVAEKDGAQLDCLLVHQSALALSLDYGGFVPPLPEAVDATIGDALKKDLDAFLKPLLRTADKLKWRSIVAERVSVREAIYDHAKETKTDLVVLGTRGKTDLRTLIVGTTAEKIVSHAPCSILAVKPDGFVSPIIEAPTLASVEPPLA